MIGEDMQKFSESRVMRTIAIGRVPIRNLPKNSWRLTRLNFITSHILADVPHCTRTQLRFSPEFLWLILQTTRLVGTFFKIDVADYYQTLRFSRRQKEKTARAKSKQQHPEGLTALQEPAGATTFSRSFKP
ncbi:hypothetical protein AVEN_41932-1 [Araneus ventricosus]|uniref:Uncharacterized protein n=1 Tax=Araneus ventricosus TaxID=182803 RepID=A0A4Y2AE32_ARAVE|nr:hypothetical protein AVEN_41932-1 [Araneus ventricosus]